MTARQQVIPIIRTKLPRPSVDVDLVCRKWLCGFKVALEAVSEALAQEVKAFGVRVGIVEPRIVNTVMARSISNSQGRTSL